MKDKNEFLELRNYAEEMYLGYSLAVIKERALPFLTDGQKPVQRRVLYAMKELGIKFDAPPKKSARVVGDVIGKYHPHGDTSVYEAMVRMSQNWNLRYPLIDGQGNFGSRDGDGAAAMRYTEARLTKFAESVLLDELKMGTVNFKSNYDNTMVEPDAMPSKLNMLLLNGATGIAVGMACDIPSHNMRELTDVTVEAISNPKITHERIMEIIKGPDYPTGGQIIDSQEKINTVYEKGQGVLRVRAKWKVEKKARGQWQVVINELPPNASTASILSNIDKITNPPVKKGKDGKAKKPSAKVLADKNFLLNTLDQAIDDSDKDSPVRLILVPKSSKVDPDDFVHSILNKIGLEESVKVNFTMVGIDGQAKLKSIKETILEWIEHRFGVLTKRTEFSLKKTQDRIHVLEGRLLAFLNIDEVIKIIKNSDEPKEELMKKINVSEVQAEDILEIKLRQLAKLEGIKIEKDLEQLKKDEKKYLGLLSSKTKMNNLMKKEIQEETAKFEDERRTLIKEAEAIKVSAISTIVEEDVTVIITKNGWLTSRKGHQISLDSLQLKESDKVAYCLEGKNSQNVAVLSSSGRIFNLKTIDIPNGKNFIHIERLCDLKGANVIHAWYAKESDYLVYNNDGYGFITEGGSLQTKNKAGKAFMNLPNEDSEIKVPILLRKEDEDKWVSIITNDNRLLCFTMKELRELKKLEKGKGYQLVKLVDNVKIDELKIIDPNKYYVKDGRKKLKLNENEDVFLSKRARRGKIIKGKESLVEDIK